MSAEDGKNSIGVSVKSATGEVTLTQVEQIRVSFGPHYFADIFQKDGRIKFVVGATHHGFMADASEVGSQLEQLVYELRATHPELAVD